MFEPDPSSTIARQVQTYGTWQSGHGEPTDLTGNGSIYWDLDNDVFYQQQGDRWVQVSA